MLELSSHRVTDDDGLPLRTSHFPFNLERKSPPKSAGFGLKPVNPPEKKVIGKSVRTLSSSASLQPTPTTYMMVDYQQDRKAITAKLLVETMRKDRVLPASLATGIPSAARSPRIRRSPNRPPQPLRSSFLLRSQPSVIGKGANELNLPSSLMYQKDEAIQTAAELERLDLNISAYQSWSNKTVEPFLKVSYIYLKYFMCFLAISLVLTCCLLGSAEIH